MPEPKEESKSTWGAAIRGGMAAVFLALIAPFVAFSENSLKSLLGGWLDDCVIAFERQQRQSNVVLVAGYMRGKVPTELPFYFRALNGKLLHSIRFESTEDLTGQSSYGSLARHPLSGQPCPGDLCRAELFSNDGETGLSFTLKHLNDAFAYRFFITFTQEAQPTDLGVFLQFHDKSTGYCRAENANLLNLPMRMERWGKVLLGAMLLLGVTVAVGAINRWRAA